ncbi:unnamed protein product, partial [Mesorhabditis spiculigera]
MKLEVGLNECLRRIRTSGRGLQLVIVVLSIFSLLCLLRLQVIQNYYLRTDFANLRLYRGRSSIRGDSGFKGRPCITPDTIKDDPSKDFYEFSFEGSKRILPKFISFTVSPTSPCLIPEDNAVFQKFWTLSRKIDCRNIDMKRPTPPPRTTTDPELGTEERTTATRPPLDRIHDHPLVVAARKTAKKDNDNVRRVPLEAIAEIVFLRDFILNHAITPLLFFGALLGWYRECSIIPHTNDFDFAIRSDEVPDSFFDALENMTIPLRPDRRLGLRNESLEYTVKSVKHGFPIDLFVLYDTENSTYAPGQGQRLESYRFVFPKIQPDDICAAELLNHFFYVPCQVERHILTEHGPQWATDKPTKRFSWNNGVANVVKIKTYPQTMKPVVQHYFEEG